MKDLIKTFSVPKEGKVSDKTFTYNIVAGILGMLLCLTSLTAATWAWFGSSITAGNNSIQSGNYSVEEKVLVTVESDAENSEPTQQTVTPNEDGTYTLKAGEYQITLTGTGSASTGYCTVTLATGGDVALADNSDPTVYHTVQIYNNATDDTTVNAEEKPNAISFVIDVGEDSDDVQLSIVACWGTSARRDEEKIHNGDTLNIGSNQGDDVTDNTENSDSDPENAE